MTAAISYIRYDMHWGLDGLTGVETENKIDRSCLRGNHLNLFVSSNEVEDICYPVPRIARFILEGHSALRNDDHLLNPVLVLMFPRSVGITGKLDEKQGYGSSESVLNVYI
jgi:hypothetical protein